MSLSSCIILCDQVYPCNTGKFVLAGTYTSWNVICTDWKRPSCQFHQGLQCYIRYAPEKTGKTDLTIVLKDQRRDIWDQHWFKTGVTVDVQGPENGRLPPCIELPVRTPEFSISIEPKQELGDGPIRHALIMELLLDDELIASTPLDIIFHKIVEKKNHDKQG